MVRFDRAGRAGNKIAVFVPPVELDGDVLRAASVSLAAYTSIISMTCIFLSCLAWCYFKLKSLTSLD